MKTKIENLESRISAALALLEGAGHTAGCDVMLHNRYHAFRPHPMHEGWCVECGLHPDALRHHERKPCTCIIGKLRAALQGTNGEHQAWRPIDTAPQDEVILIYAAGFQIAHYNLAGKKWIGYGWETSDTRRLNNSATPTHWMPLPSAPPVVDLDAATGCADDAIPRDVVNAIRTVLDGSGA